MMMTRCLSAKNPSVFLDRTSLTCSTFSEVMPVCLFLNSSNCSFISTSLEKSSCLDRYKLAVDFYSKMLH